jgi:mRNA-degrading endonuclease RelE of RelBE toxin-antitoxin system
MIYSIKYTSDVEAQIQELPEDRRTKFFEGMSHLVTDPYPKDCVRFESTVKWRVTNYLTVTYLVSERLIAVVAVVLLDDTMPYFRAEDA